MLIKIPIRYFLATIAFTFLWAVPSFNIYAFGAEQNDPAPRDTFNFDKDILIANFDCKTDVDDLHSVAAFITLMSVYDRINYYAVAGAYGIQDGLYVPPNSLFELAFGDDWTDAHTDFNRAVAKVTDLAGKTLEAGGHIWFAEAGQSDFTAAVVKSLNEKYADLDLKLAIHVVQHSEWNESVTSRDAIQYVKDKAEYIRIPDGNAVGNGSPGFRTPESLDFSHYMDDPTLLEIWQHAIELANTYNGKDGRYLNEAIAEGGMDFSDLSETCWILGEGDLTDVQAFFEFVEQRPGK